MKREVARTPWNPRFGEGSRGSSEEAFEAVGLTMARRDRARRRGSAAAQSQPRHVRCRETDAAAEELSREGLDDQASPFHSHADFSADGKASPFEPASVNTQPRYR